jgi:methionine-rich copper-binding protein CopC
MTRCRGRFARAALGLCASLATVMVAAGPAEAHAKVVRTTPTDGTTTNGRISVVRVVFDDPVRLVPRSLVVSGSTGAPEPIGAPRVIHGRTLEASVPGRLPAGRYFVGWRILSDDGHVESGSFGFTVAAAGAAKAPPAAVGSSTPAPAQPIWPVIVAAVMAGVAVLGGALVAVRGLAAVRNAAGASPRPADVLDAASAREHAPMRH